MTGPFCKAVVLLLDDIENNEKGGGDIVKAFPLFVTSLGNIEFHARENTEKSEL